VLSKRCFRRFSAAAEQATTGGNLLQRTRCSYFANPRTLATTAAGDGLRPSEESPHAASWHEQHCIATIRRIWRWRDGVKPRSRFRGQGQRSALDDSI